MMKNQTEKINYLLNSILKSKKYRHILPPLVETLGQKEIEKRKSLKEAVKCTKNKLHQIGGSFFCSNTDYSFWLKNLTECENSISIFKDICVNIMSCHTSTRERLSFLEIFYKEIFSLLPEIDSILDLGCGLNLLSIFWMPLKKDCSYYGFDIYIDMIDFLNSFMNLRNISGYGKTLDLSRYVPEEKADLAFIFKLLPVLEQTAGFSSLDFLERLNVKYIALSFPAKTLCGRNKNMAENYEKKFRDLVNCKSWEIKKLKFETEIVFIIFK